MRVTPSMIASGFALTPDYLSTSSYMLTPGYMPALGNILAFDEITARAISIAVTGMLIVMVALSIITLFIAALPRILPAVAKVFPEHEDLHARQVHTDSTIADDEAVLAGIGFVLHTEFQKQVSKDQVSRK